MWLLLHWLRWLLVSWRWERWWASVIFGGLESLPGQVEHVLVHAVGEQPGGADGPHKHKPDDAGQKGEGVVHEKADEVHHLCS